MNRRTWEEQKREREILRPPVQYGKILEDRVWTYRDVSDESHIEIVRAVGLINKSEAKPKALRHTVSLFYPEEMRLAINQSCLSGNKVARQIAAILKPRLPGSLNEPVLAQTVGIRQYPEIIGVAVNYPGFEEERQGIVHALNGILRTKHDWKIETHINIAKGDISNLSNIDQIAAAIPPYVQLNPAILQINGEKQKIQ